MIAELTACEVAEMVVVEVKVVLPRTVELALVSDDIGCDVPTTGVEDVL